MRSVIASLVASNDSGEFDELTGSVASSVDL